MPSHRHGEEQRFDRLSPCCYDAAIIIVVAMRRSSPPPSSRVRARA